jgi:D-alanyl-D-alanine carboxypeptidase (penicillin-binding protein 5/6)
MRLSSKVWGAVAGALAVGAGVVAVQPLSSSAAPAAPRTQVVQPVAASSPAGVKARAALLLNGSTGKVLWSRAADTKLTVGSITKVMTALVVLHSGHLDRKITIKQAYLSRVSGTLGGSSAGLKVGDKISARELLYGLMLPSGCDAAAALADAYGPGYTGFVKKMNAEAVKVGLTRTHYNNFDGLNYTPGDTKWSDAHPPAWSTARDQVKLARFAMKYKTFRAVAAKRTHVLAMTSLHKRYSWGNTNHLLGAYPGVVGIKTGHTDLAGYCLLFADKRSGKYLIGVVLNSTKTVESARFADATKMLDWAFRTRTFISLTTAARGLPTD